MADKPFRSSDFTKTTAQVANVITSENLKFESQGNNDPLKFTSLKYPLDISSTGLGHYIMFYMVSPNSMSGNFQANNDKQFGQKLGLVQGFDVSQSRQAITDIKQYNSGTQETRDVLSESNSIFSKAPTHTTTTGCITLYMPPGISVTYSQEIDQADTGLIGLGFQAAGQEGSEAAMDLLKGGAAFAFDKASTLVSDFLSTSGLTEGNIKDIGTKALGLAVNPQQETFYRKPNFRSFTYQFSFHPRNEQEAKEVHNILWLFKYHSHPSIQGADGQGIGRYFKEPSQFEIYYMYNGENNDMLNKISRCYLETIDVKYGPEGQFSTFEPSYQSNDVKGTYPVQTTASLKFTETTYLTKQLIEKGY